MNLHLHRVINDHKGIVGVLLDDDCARIAVTMEHAYPAVSSAIFYPKLPAGTYVCERGIHRLKDYIEPFETFEVLKVPGATGILFHIGNMNSDSQGCILLGEDLDPTFWAIENSRLTFDAFMQSLKGISTFNLTVS